MEVVGKIKVIGTANQVSDKFTKRDVVITTDEQYPQDIQIQFVQEKCEILDKYTVGQEVTIGINLRGREWNNAKGETVYFNTIQGWNIKETDNSKQVPQANSQTFAPAPALAIEDDSDLPF